ncbi:MAG: valine--tRNA ligase [Alphaproteobacteria bacterium]|nr:valine--tRNA ligase [Alphaproteobacteria bacterium]
MLDKTYRPQDVELRLYQAWEASGAFARGRRGDAKPFTIVIPPPNVTGSLHMGHALNSTLQDILIRFRRMQGRDALWQPGTDHAGIATQMVVERQLAQERTSRAKLGRKAFVDRVWAWKAESGGTITRQLRRLGASCDWSRERFTLDDGLSDAVRLVFVELYRAGLIYRDKRLVNWDPVLHTAISDLEVEQRPASGWLWYLRYPIEGKDGTFITVATTRPETMLGDTAVAVHPDDERYRNLVGSFAILPLVGRRLPIVADAYSDPEKGSGAVKITPAHDFNDFEVGRRHGLAMVNVLDADGKLDGDVPEAYRGLDRFVARDRIVADLQALGLVESIEPHAYTVPHGDRSGTVIEPWLTDQWYVDAATLAKPAIEAVEQGRTVFVPKTWENTYFEWMRNIQPWCISRQLWWGHRIPAWYGPDGKVFVGMDEAEARAQAQGHYGRDVALTRDEDVLDTWFSSALWPFSTLGWPDQTPELARHYPTDVLVTGFDIIFFWVARMMMMGLRFMGEVPFHTVYIHALVRDAQGQKMSKSKGNIIDPLDLIDKYGADALRFTLAAMAAQGRDIKLSEGRVEGYRNFITKLWNAARFCEVNGCARVAGFAPERAAQPLNRWLVGEVSRATSAVSREIEGYRFNEAAGAIYHFTWGTFCDWYLEMAKPILMGGDEAAKAEVRAAAAWSLDHILLLLHPFAPFVTEELWGLLGGPRDRALIEASWPAPAPTFAEADADIGWVIRLVSDIRSVRAELNVPPAAVVGLSVRDAGAETQRRLAVHGDLIGRLARIAFGSGDDAKGAAQLVIDEATYVMPLAHLIDVAAELARLGKQLAKLDGDVEKLRTKLADESFVAKAPDHVVEAQRERMAESQATRDRLAAALARLSQR